MGVDSLTFEHDMARKEGIAYLGPDNCLPQSKECKEVLADLERIIDTIKSNISKPDKFKAGCKVFVIGAPFRNCSNGQVEIIGFNMYADDTPNRDMEIKFKHHLYETYANKYFPFIGESLN